MDELNYIKNMCDRYISECENLYKEPPNRWTVSAANKSKIKRLGIELRQEMIDLERKYYVWGETMNKLSKMAIIAVSGLLFLTGCSEANRVSENLSMESDNFNVVRKVTVIDAITNDVMFQMSGRMSIKADTRDKQLEIVVENDKNKYQKHIVGLSDNVSYVVEDVEVPNVSKYKYEINYNPKMWVPAKLKNVD